MDEVKKTRDHYLWMYFLLTFAFSWIIWLPGVLATKGIIKLPVSNMILVGAGSFGPLLASFILTFHEGGRQGIKQLFSKAVSLDFKKIWLIPAFFMLPFLIGSSFLIYVLINGNEDIPRLQLISQPLMILPAFIAAFFIFGAVQEEFGWRGYALNRMQARWNALVSSLILGGIWAIWHLPLFFIEGTGQSRIPFTLFFLGTLGVTVIYTWLYNNTGKSVLIALLFHAMHNTSFNLFPITLLPYPEKAFLYLTILQSITAIIIVLTCGPKYMVKGLPDKQDEQALMY